MNAEFIGPKTGKQALAERESAYVESLRHSYELAQKELMISLFELWAPNSEKLKDLQDER